MIILKYLLVSPQAELLAVLDMLVEGIDKKELDKIADKFIDEIDNSEVSVKHIENSTNICLSRMT